jgi:hypothetical protein
LDTSKIFWADVHLRRGISFIGSWGHSEGQWRIDLEYGFSRLDDKTSAISWCQWWIYQVDSTKYIGSIQC